MHPLIGCFEWGYPIKSCAFIVSREAEANQIPGINAMNSTLHDGSYISRKNLQFDKRTKALNTQLTLQLMHNWEIILKYIVSTPQPERTRLRLTVYIRVWVTGIWCEYFFLHTPRMQGFFGFLFFFTGSVESVSLTG